MEDSVRVLPSAKRVKYEEIPGLVYVRGFLSKEEEASILSEVNSHPWNTSLKRRTQHFGYTYDYTAKTIDESMYMGELPGYAQRLAARLKELNLITAIPDQMIVNEYTPGQGITPHIDRPDIFGATITSVSLGSECVMQFTHGDVKEDVLLHRRSAVILQGDARYKFKHSIAQRKADIVQGIGKIQRTTRVSLTFRNIVKKNKAAETQTLVE